MALRPVHFGKRVLALPDTPSYEGYDDMSEYQYYEFQAIDRPLTEKEQQTVSRLSMRVDPHPRRAIFVYNWSDFRADPREVLVNYYDAMYYVANWGTTRLMFRFPKNLIDLQQNDILKQDYRARYLGWLAGIDSWEVTEDTVEPPVPPGLNKLTRPLRHFVDAFHLDETLVKVAAEASPDRPQAVPSNLRQLITALPRETCDQWLLRLAQGEEPHLSLAFQRYLDPVREVNTSISSSLGGNCL